MSYEDTIYFIGKCLTLANEDTNRKEIKNALKQKNTDWDSVVRVATGHFVFPALYINFRQVDFLDLVPLELKNYMIHIYELNLERNKDIILQVKEINKLFINNNIKGIFLKGAGNLIDDLYNDIGERMIGDIDLLVSLEDYKKTVELLKKDGYYRVENREHFNFLNKHYPKIIKNGSICAVEVHTKMTSKPYHQYFNHDFVKKSTKKTNFSALVLSNKNQTIYTCINKQINDRSQWYKNINLRNSYDLYLLSKKTYVLGTLKEFSYIFLYLNNFLASSHKVFNQPNSLEYLQNKNSKNYLYQENKYLINSKLNKLNKKTWDFVYFTKITYLILIKSLKDSDVRKTLLHRVKHKILHLE